MSIRSKIISLICLLPATVIAQECRLQERITSKEIGTISEIRNINAQVVPYGKGQQKCIVELDGMSQGKWYPARGEFVWDGDYSPSKACSAATELAKKNLLSGLFSSTISNETVIICKEPTEKDRPLINPKVGTILESIERLRINSAYKPFYHKGEECRWYLETGWNGKDINQFNGIVCRYGVDRWIIVDKF